MANADRLDADVLKMLNDKYGTAHARDVMRVIKGRVTLQMVENSLHRLEARGLVQHFGKAVDIRWCPSQAA
jgi:DNA-binding HxlR family transcriptional regulator